GRERRDVLALDLDEVGEVDRVLGDRIDLLEPAEDREQHERVELAVGDAAHERDVAVRVVAGDDREQRLQRRARAERVGVMNWSMPMYEGPYMPTLPLECGRRAAQLTSSAPS